VRHFIVAIGWAGPMPSECWPLIVSQLRSFVSYLRFLLPSDVSSLWSFLAGFIVAIFAEPLRQLIFRPNLMIEFRPDDSFVTSTVGIGDDRREWRQRYIRMRVRNTKRRLAKNCRAYLTNVEWLAPNGDFERSGYVDSIQLNWSARGEEALSGLDLPKGVNQFVDVITTQEAIPYFIPQTRSHYIDTKKSGGARVCSVLPFLFPAMEFRQSLRRFGSFGEDAGMILMSPQLE